eukprot:SAG11_NODE_4642_length_1824_cov_1.534493_2_plen_250_part_00
MQSWDHASYPFQKVYGAEGRSAEMRGNPSKFHSAVRSRTAFFSLLRTPLPSSVVHSQALGGGLFCLRLVRVLPTDRPQVKTPWNDKQEYGIWQKNVCAGTQRRLAAEKKARARVVRANKSSADFARASSIYNQECLAAQDTVLPTPVHHVPYSVLEPKPPACPPATALVTQPWRTKGGSGYIPVTTKLRPAWRKAGQGVLHGRRKIGGGGKHSHVRQAGHEIERPLGDGDSDGGSIGEGLIGFDTTTTV